MNPSAQNQNVPPGAPQCFGRSYASHDKECVNCSFNYQCKQACGTAAQIPQQPPPQQYQYWSPPPPPQQYQYPTWRPPQPAVSPPPTALIAPQNLYRGVQQAYAPAPPAVGGQYGGQDYGSMFGQYPNESTGERLGKNLILRSLEAAFNEMTRFFHYWTWPKDG